MRGRFDESQAAITKARFEQLLGGHGATVRLAHALQTSRQHLHKIWSGESGLPEWLIVIAELLERTPRANWPERWIEVMKGRMLMSKREALQTSIYSLYSEELSSSTRAGYLDDSMWRKCGEIVSDARSILADEGLLGPWETSDLDYATLLTQHRYMLRLALASVERAFSVSNLRANGDMTEKHYQEQIARLPRQADCNASSRHSL